MSNPVTCTELRCDALATVERTHPNGHIDDLCDAHAAEFDAAMAERLAELA